MAGLFKPVVIILSENTLYVLYFQESLKLRFYYRESFIDFEPSFIEIDLKLIF